MSDLNEHYVSPDDQKGSYSNTLDLEMNYLLDFDFFKPQVG